MSLLRSSGTGKTSTIVHAVRALVASGASVLVAAYTNSALDNILTKLADSGMHQFLRLGRASSCHARVREYMPGGDRCAAGFLGCPSTAGALSTAPGAVLIIALQQHAPCDSRRCE